MATFMSGFKDGGQVIVPVPLEFTDPGPVVPSLATNDEQLLIKTFA
jgi:hypothetical protein